MPGYLSADVDSTSDGITIRELQSLINHLLISRFITTDTRVMIRVGEALATPMDQIAWDPVEYGPSPVLRFGDSGR